VSTSDRLQEPHKPHTTDNPRHMWIMQPFLAELMTDRTHSSVCLGWISEIELWLRPRRQKGVRHSRHTLPPLYVVFRRHRPPRLYSQRLISGAVPTTKTYTSAHRGPSRQHGVCARTQSHQTMLDSSNNGCGRAVHKRSDTCGEGACPVYVEWSTRRSRQRLICTTSQTYAETPLHKETFLHQQYI
jgi:hypothetical protein